MCIVALRNKIIGATYLVRNRQQNILLKFPLDPFLGTPKPKALNKRILMDKNINLTILRQMVLHCTSIFGGCS
jgi:hypothetical protein